MDTEISTDPALSGLFRTHPKISLTLCSDFVLISGSFSASWLTRRATICKSKMYLHATQAALFRNANPTAVSGFEKTLDTLPILKPHL